MKIILDAGGLIALERGHPGLWQRWRDALRVERTVVTHGGVVGQVWRSGGARQARLATVMRGIEILPLGEALGRAAGELLHAARTSDVIDAALVLLSSDGDEIVTSDPDDIVRLARAARRDVDIVEV